MVGLSVIETCKQKTTSAEDRDWRGPLLRICSLVGFATPIAVVVNATQGNITVVRKVPADSYLPITDAPCQIGRRRGGLEVELAACTELELERLSHQVSGVIQERGIQRNRDSRPRWEAHVRHELDAGQVWIVVELTLHGPSLLAFHRQ